MTRVACTLAILLLLTVAARATDKDDIAAAIKEKNGSGTGAVRVSGDWALADELSPAGMKTAQAVMRKINEHWVVSAELTGTGQATPEALDYHEVPEGTARKLLGGQTRDEMKPILTLLRQMMPDHYPEGALLEDVAIADRWAICFYRYRASLKKSDVMWQALLRNTGGKWHLVEKSDKPIDLKQYGVPAKVQRVLAGEASAGPPGRE